VTSINRAYNTRDRAHLKRHWKIKAAIFLEKKNGFHRKAVG
jgi:hypothetical protein